LEDSPISTRDPSAIETLARKDTWSLIRRLLSENARDKWHAYAVSIVLLAIVSGATGLSAYVMEDVINEIFVSQRSDMIPVIAAAVAGIFIIKGAASYGNAVILARASNSIVARLQRRMYDRLLEQDLRFFNGVQLGDLLVRFQSGVQGAREAVNTLILSIGRDFFSLVALVAVMVIQDPMLSISALLIAPPAILGVMHLMRKVKEVARSEVRSLSQLMTQVKETALGVHVVKTFRLEDHMRAGMAETVAAVERRQNRMAVLGAATVPLMETLGGVAIAVAIVYGGWRVVGAGNDPGSFFSFITALLLAYEPARRLARFNVQFQQNMIGVTMVYALLDMPPSPAERQAPSRLEVRDGEISFEKVTFRYRGGERNAALRGLTIEVPPRSVTALVGPSGGGKSTIFALLSRLYLPDSGRILIDGQDISEVSAGSVRAAVAVVSQDTFLFEGSIRDNLRMGRLDATDAEIEAAARAAHAHDFIMEQPQGYDTQVGEGGGLLSGGQRQRIAIARAMLADAPILLFDEATSALDSESEAKVQEAMERLIGGRTTLVIAHRLSTIRHAQRIHVIDRGTCVETGTHDELIRAAGFYARLHEIQFREMAGPSPKARAGAAGAG
jgi:ATP-binding cassette subfamily B protein